MPVPPLGSRSQIAALIRGMQDALGNRDGISGNEALPAGSAASTSLLDRNPLLNRLRDAFEPGLSTVDEQQRLREFVASREQQWGQPVTALAPEAIPNFELFRTEKAIALTRFGRSPADVTEGVVKARGTVDGQPIADRDVFWQRWKPVGTPSGRVVVISPGFQETGRNFYEQIALLNRRGDDVIVMDHQWAGYTSGPKGGVDRGFGVARDVAAVAAMAQQVADQDYAGKSHRVVLLGNSMGAGPGVLGALTLNDAGRIHLDGPQMPKGLDAVLQSPFLEMTPSLVNRALEAASHVPVLSDLALPSMGLPVLTHDPAAAARGAQHVAEEQIVARPRAMSAAGADLQTIHQLIASGEGPKGHVYIVHGDRDPLADPKGSVELQKLLGDRAKLELIRSNNHVLEESPSEQRHILAGLDWLANADH